MFFQGNIININDQADGNTGTWPFRLGEFQMRQSNMAVISAGFGPKSDCSGKVQK
jgi:hypothetical protein